MRNLPHLHDITTMIELLSCLGVELLVDEKLLDYCVVRMERSLGSAARLVESIDAEALARKSPVTRATASAALEKLGMA